MIGQRHVIFGPKYYISRAGQKVEGGGGGWPGSLKP